MLLVAGLGLLLLSVRTWRQRGGIGEPVEISALRAGLVATRGVLSSSDGRSGVLRDATGACDVLLEHTHLADEIKNADGAEVLVFGQASDGALHGIGYRSSEARIAVRGTPWAPMIVTTMSRDALRRRLGLSTTLISIVGFTAVACAYLLVR
ncbi:MAG: hypothetical protein JRI68_09200 [Deltaproteobacteria bacterium]|nr:hypothetical protein [Deltaproteobacteria bacterium]